LEITPELLKKLRNDLDYSQKEMAQAIGVSIRSYQRWEWGLAYPRPAHRRQIKELMTKAYGERVHQEGEVH